MRVLFGVVSLLVVVAIAAVLAKKQLSPVPVPPVSVDGSVSLPLPSAGSTPQQQSQQIQQQVRQRLENTLQQARPMPEDN